MAKPIPDGFNSVSAHLIVRNCAKAIEFYKKAFGAEEICSMPTPDGKIMHAELKFGNSTVMMCEEMPEMGATSPQALNGTAVTIHLYVEDADKMYTRAVGAGATATMPIMDAFWGDRYGKLTDPFGHHWSVATHKKDMTPEQIGQAAAEFFSGQGGKCGQ
jgi:uncharacterized glyoxalase superfamily protein PhnB